ncbi:hypothetical protein CC80DRAFT_259117 [Byssothecium circinans]|uniref:Uncharacterized protein n=1 Tax=Byssothecium circinans TaxID=147558 RepID=A0A6A5U9N6_9PLEO|nr:hypothetical protein CC80DRAFT_259117 [Byssothecium circinans]
MHHSCSCASVGADARRPQFAHICSSPDARCTSQSCTTANVPLQHARIGVRYIDYPTLHRFLAKSHSIFRPQAIVSALVPQVANIRLPLLIKARSPLPSRTKADFVSRISLPCRRLIVSCLSLRHSSTVRSLENSTGYSQVMPGLLYCAWSYCLLHYLTSSTSLHVWLVGCSGAPCRYGRCAWRNRQLHRGFLGRALSPFSSHLNHQVIVTMAR